MTTSPTGTITFLFTDIEGSTRLWEAHPEAMQGAVARHDALLRHAVEANNGWVFKTTGDGVAAAFATAADALAAALAGQRALLAEPWAEDVVLRSRMSLHTGAAELRDGDYFGSTLNRAVRLMYAGHGGQTLLSDATHELCRDTLPPDVTLLPLGEYRLKDLARPETVYQLAHPDLGVDFPTLRTLDVTPNNLPQQVTSFVGREKALADVATRLKKTRLLTLTGSGGSGKTRLSLQAAADALDDFPDGVWLVELASLSDPTLVPQTVAAALGVREQTGPSLTQTLADYLKSRHLLLVLDNCEHVLQTCTQLVATLIRACPQVKVIATSREPLGIGGELVFRVPSLSLPTATQVKAATAENLTQFEAVRLFIERAQFVKFDFGVTNANAPALAQLCYRLDGIPLAIELAAARVRSLPVEQINEKLDSRFRLLTGGDRSALPRQQTLRALIDWSYDLLTESENTLLARLSVFAGGWTLEAAEAICGWTPIEDWEVLDLLTSLADKSLVQTEEEGGVPSAAMRNRLLETIRQYAQERLLANGPEDTASVRIRHADFFAGLAEAAQSHLMGPEQASWLNRLEMEHDNLRTALDTCAELAADTSSKTFDAAQAGLRLAGALARFWEVRGYLSEGREHLARALATYRAQGDPTHTQIATRKAAAGSLRGAGILAYRQGDYRAARAQYEEGLSLYREIGDKSGTAATLSNLGNVAADQGDYATARALQEESLSLRRQIGEKGGIASTLNNLGIVAYSQGDYPAARALQEESLSLRREIGDRGGIASALNNLGIVAYTQNDYPAAQAQYEESLTLYRETGDKSGIASALGNLGNIACRAGDYKTARAQYAESLALFREIGDKSCIAIALESMASVHPAGVAGGAGNVRWAAILWGAASALRRNIGAPLSPVEQAAQNLQMAQARAIAGAAAFAAAWDEGRALSWEQAVDLALG